MRTIGIWSVFVCFIGALSLAAAAEEAPPPAPQAEPPAPQAPPAAVQTPPAPAPAFDPSRSDEKAIAVVDKVIAASGGDVWSKTRFVKFTWVWQQGEGRLDVTHYWDKVAGRSRMEGKSKDGVLVIAVVDHGTKTGLVTKAGQPLQGDDAQRYIEIAYNRLYDDSYWFFMPFELKDGGVRLRYEGEIKAGPITYDKILVTFDEGTSRQRLGDRFWVYVNRESNMIERWSYLMPGQSQNTSPIAWQWADWTEVEGLKLATRRTQPGGESEVVLENVQIFESLPETVFTAADPFEASAPTSTAAGL